MEPIHKTKINTFGKSTTQSPQRSWESWALKLIIILHVTQRNNTIVNRVIKESKTQYIVVRNSRARRYFPRGVTPCNDFFADIPLDKLYQHRQWALPPRCCKPLRTTWYACLCVLQITNLLLAWSITKVNVRLIIV